MAEIIFSILKNSLSITFFVLAMMLFIEYINVRTRGSFCAFMQRGGWRQIVLGVVFGLIPGCLGTYTVVTLYSHNLVSIGALFATFVATMGDESFILMSIDMPTALKVSAVLLVIALIGGFLIDFLYKQKNLTKHVEHFEIHEHEHGDETAIRSSIINNLKNPSPHRATLLFGIIVIFVLSLLGEIGHSHDFMPMSGEIIHDEHTHHVDWFSLTFIIISIATAYVISIVSDHFLETHLWNHVVKKHFLKMFGWTTLVIAFVYVIDQWIPFQDIVSQYQWQILIGSVLIGLIPESGPHIIFISLFLSGQIPFSILLANSIVQEGHGGLPLIAESKKTFLLLKTVKSVIAIIIGFLGLSLGF